MSIELLSKVLETYSVKDIAEELNVAKGTVKRWIELENVPSSYTFDLMKMLKLDIKYEDFSYKEKDQFFTPTDTAKKCYDIILKKMKELGEDETEYTYIEPSAGDGSFLKALPQNRIIAFDIEPRHDSIIKQDYLEWTPQDNKKYIVIGNPPFGLRGQLALKFINHSKFANFVAFILPQLFESDGKGVPRKRVNDFHLIHSEKIDSSFYDPDKKKTNINVVFQIWAKEHSNVDFDINDTTNDTIKVYSLSDGGTSSSTRNKDMIDKCHAYLPSTCFGKENMRCYQSFEDLPNRKGYGIVFLKNRKDLEDKCKGIDWLKVSFLSTNSAYNLRTSQIIKQFL